MEIILLRRGEIFFGGMDGGIFSGEGSAVGGEFMGGKSFEGWSHCKERLTNAHM
jgi:hypothetical protein